MSNALNRRTRVPLDARDEWRALRETITDLRTTIEIILDEMEVEELGATIDVRSRAYYQQKVYKLLEKLYKQRAAYEEKVYDLALDGDEDAQDLCPD